MNRRVYTDLDMLRMPMAQVEMLRLLFNARCWTMLGMHVTGRVSVWYDKAAMATIVEWE